jgi:hypothetical protein
MNKVDADRFNEIDRKVQYGITMKDLVWLVRLVRKLDEPNPQPSAERPIPASFPHRQPVVPPKLSDIPQSKPKRPSAAYKKGRKAAKK